MAVWAICLALQTAASMTANVQSLRLNAKLRALMSNEVTAHAVWAWTEGAQLTAAIGVAGEPATRTTMLHIWWATHV